MSDLDWYRSLEAFDEFNELTDDEHYQRVPSGWVVILTDIVDSTSAIAQGRYKDVNTIGAACIVAAQNALNRQPFPFVFGGDGATLVLPQSCSAAVQQALAAVASLARDTFSLELRIGSIPVDELDRLGCPLEVAKHRLVGAQTIAIFRGGALAMAESIIKRGEESVSATHATDGGELDGLSCRWQPIQSLNGRIATLMITAVGANQQGIYRDTLAQLDAILSGDVRSANPIHHQNMLYRGLREILRDEWRYATRRLTPRFMHRLFEIIAAVCVFKWSVPPMVFSPARYATSLGAHCDFRKFDDTLRMVVDITPRQLAAIRAMLEASHARGEIRFGLHESPTALITCFVYGLDEGEHIHFVDGGDGGYAVAAQQMKAQAAAHFEHFKVDRSPA